MIGEIGLSWPLLDCERKVLVAAHTPSAPSSQGLVIHPGRHPDAPFEALEIVASCGVDLARVVMSHARPDLRRPDDDRTARPHRSVRRVRPLRSREQLLPVLGLLHAERRRSPPPDPRPRRRGATPSACSSPTTSTARCTPPAYGGEGYGHILKRVVPPMEKLGLPGDLWRQFLVTNPAAVLCGPPVPKGA